MTINVYNLDMFQIFGHIKKSRGKKKLKCPTHKL